MIFVTMGTHEQQFNRLVKEIDTIAQRGMIEDNFFIQRGYSTYEPRFCEYQDFLDFEDMKSYMEKADIIITHGGPSSFMEALLLGKKTIIVPRQFQFEEHVNDHQGEFLSHIQGEMGLMVVNDIETLETVIQKVDSQPAFISHNAQFNEELYQLIRHILE